MSISRKNVEENEETLKNFKFKCSMVNYEKILMDKTNFKNASYLA